MDYGYYEKFRCELQIFGMRLNILYCLSLGFVFARKILLDYLSNLLVAGIFRRSISVSSR
jgi:hypothetical protein